MALQGRNETRTKIASSDSSVADDLHILLIRKYRKEKLLFDKLINTAVDVDQRNKEGMTPLHVAAKMGEEACAKVLIAFGADINKVDNYNRTPLDLAKEEPVKHLLETFQAKATNISQQHNALKSLNRLGELKKNINRRHTISSPNECMATSIQEVEKYKETGGVSSFPSSGSRLLFLDGGGMKGLVQIEVLCQMEQKTGRKITELFDWIVGTSTGAIIALGLVYGKKSLNEMRQLYFRMNDTFKRIGPKKLRKEFKEILKETVGSKTRMNDVSYPRVLITAVFMQPLELHFFNNCFGDKFSEELVWKVACYTSNHPMFFGECDNYLDGGLLANNPCDYGMTAIQSYYREDRVKLPIAVVVSVGTGIVANQKKLGKVDFPCHNLSSFGDHWITLPYKLITRIPNLLRLLGNATVESESVAKNCRSRCEEQNIPFYRFSPQLNDDIQGLTVDNKKLLNMVIQAKIQAKEQGMDELIDMFCTIAEAASIQKVS